MGNQANYVSSQFYTSQEDGRGTLLFSQNSACATNRDGFAHFDVSRRQVLHQPRMKALLVGINYFGQCGQLKQSIRDAQSMYTCLVRSSGLGREDMVILTDDQHNLYSQPSKENILRALRWLVKDVQPNDKLYFYYCGHGTNLFEQDQRDTSDCIYPADFRLTGIITREDLNRIVVDRLPTGVHLTEIMDTYHPSPMHGMSCPSSFGMSQGTSGLGVGPQWPQEKPNEVEWPSSNTLNRGHIGTIVFQNKGGTKPTSSEMLEAITKRTPMNS
ncbi:Ca(2+)-dependent cysteine protease [Cladophialophora chaetospira]|uniref:Ca(2+)-dependent cysteine protease n=1 Tax=Cladophialophora chaetospira TaxID=386627 RepID=A0AA39CHU1_9EURO|nr:Ca(2+)-dependent cysteine protease [Cladophialophora chaetospira]